MEWPERKTFFRRRSCRSCRSSGVAEWGRSEFGEGVDGLNEHENDNEHDLEGVQELQEFRRCRMEKGGVLRRILSEIRNGIIAGANRSF